MAEVTQLRQEAYMSRGSLQRLIGSCSSWTLTALGSADDEVACALRRHRNQDSSAVVSDAVTVVRNTSCPSQTQGSALPPAMAMAPTMLIAGAG